MTRCLKYLIMNIIFLTLVVWLYSYGAAEPISNEAGLHIKEGKISAELTNVPLTDIVRKIEAQGGIWLEAGADLAGNKISVRFTDLSLKEGLKRILTNMNHSLVYNADGKVAGVFILSQGGKKQDKSGSEKVPVNLNEGRPDTDASGSNENTASSGVSPLRLVNPSSLPRAPSRKRAKTFDTSFSLGNQE